MQGETIRKGVYYRCTARTLAPGSAKLAEHPKTVNLREDVLVEALNRWIGRLFHRNNLDRTVAALLASQGSNAAEVGVREAAKQRLADAEARLRRYQAAIDSGVDPEALVDVINQAQAERIAARAEIENAPANTRVTDAEIHAMIDSHRRCRGYPGRCQADRARPPVSSAAPGDSLRTKRTGRLCDSRSPCG